MSNDLRVPKLVPMGKPGQGLSAAAWNRVAKAVNDPLRTIAPPRQTRTSTSAVAAFAKQFRVVREAGDYVECEPYDGSEPPADQGTVIIAKPYLLRRTPFDGESRDGVTFDYAGDDGTAATRTATLDSDATISEQQEISPGYEVGDIIYAMGNIVGGVYLRITFGDGTQVDAEWLDMNVDARAWARSSDP